MQIGYIDFVKRIYPKILPMIFSDPYACLYDKPLGVQMSLYSIIGKRATGIADLQFGGNIITIQLPTLINLYDTEQFDQVSKTDQIATDIVASLIHEAFHINQDIDVERIHIDQVYKMAIENANMAASDRWMLNHIMQLNEIVVQSHPLYYGLNLSRLLYEYNSISQYLPDYHLKDMEQTITQKIKLIYPTVYNRLLNVNTSRLLFTDGNPIYLKYNGNYDCTQVCNSITNFNRLLYSISHGLSDLKGKFIETNDGIDCQFDTDWELITLHSFAEF